MSMLLTNLKLVKMVITEPQCIFEAFADHFSTIFNSPSSVIILNNAQSFTSNFLNAPPISDSDVKKAIRHLSSLKSVGEDEIPSFIIEGCSESFAPLLRHIFNTSLLKGKFPTLWKQVAVVPIFKKGNSILVTNYRPITILNNFSKFFESIIHLQLSSYLKFKLHPSQHGFIKSKSTATNLVTYLNSITASVSSKGQTVTIYFDLRESFDKVSRTLLLHKLNSYGLSEQYITWFKSYLSYRSSIVRTLGKFSSPFPILSGVPQGFTLGSLLFNIFALC
jgi:hypothetical protein